MPEALTESFCERCGTKYEFAAPTRLNTIRKTRGVISGLKNYIMSQDALGDAMGDAMRSEEEALAAQQLEAFHESFNFCIDCRQYTCVNCWNDDAGRCRSCVPVAGTDDLLERFEATFHAQHPELAEAAAAADRAQADLDRRLGLDTWPSADLAAGNGRPSIEWPEVEVAPALSAEPEPEPEPVVAEVEPEPEPEPEPVVAEVEAESEPEPVVAEVEPEPAMASSIDWEADAAFELEPIIVAPEPVAVAEPEPVAAEPEPVLASEPEPEPEPVLASESPAEPEPAPAPQPPAAPVPIRPISETILRIPPPTAPPVEQPERVAAQADDAELAARRAKLELLGIGDPGEGPVTDRRRVVPYRSSGAAVHPAEHAAAGMTPLHAVGSFWEASAREVAGAMTQVGVQSCGQCGLSLSATARFCRRCGTRQDQPA
jgi:hypothetical protein